jgi:predicted permease
MRDFESAVRDRLAFLALPPDREDKIVEEWAAQIEDLYQALREGGMSDAEAWSESLRHLPDRHVAGGLLLEAEPAVTRLVLRRTPTGDRLRARIRGLRERLATGIAGDFRTALRRLAKDRGFSAAVVLTLAACLGANAAIFAVVRAVLLRPLPVPEADRIVAIGDVYPTVTPNDILASDVPSYFDRRDAVTALGEQALFMFWYDTIAIGAVPEEFRGVRTTPSLFRLLGVAPALGRAFADADGELGAEHKIILGHGLWQRLYGGDASAIGRQLRLGWTGRLYTVVGVMPRGFSFFDSGYPGHAGPSGQAAQFWIPLAFTPAQRADSARARYGFFHIGRLEAGATVEQVQAQVDAVRKRIVERFPDLRLAELGMYTAVTPLQEALTRSVRRTLHVLWAGAGFVLLIGAINVVNLALARSHARARELATRLALGARRYHLIRQLLVEGMVPAAIGGAAGLALGAGLVRLLSSAVETLPNAAGIEMDGVVIVSVAAAAAFFGLLVGLVPLGAAGAASIRQVLTDGSRLGTPGRAARVLRSALVVTQVAVSVVLLVGAALLATSMRHLLTVDAGFRPARVTTATIFPPPSRYPDGRAVADLCHRLLDRIRSIPGVEAAGVTTNVALSGFASPSTVSAAGREPAPGEAALVPSVVGVSPGYFEAMGTELVRGRYFADADREGAQPVAILDERLAARLWPNEDPIGRAIHRGESGPYTVVGVVREVRFESLTATAESIGTAYFPHTNAPPLPRLRWIAVRSATGGAAIVNDLRAVLPEIDPHLPLSDVQTMTERRWRSLGSHSLAIALSSLFGAAALFLSMLGLYGVLAYSVARRTREIGIRMALGSTVGRVFQLVFAEGVLLTAAGLVLGVAGALAAGRALEGQLHGVRPADPGVLAAVAAATGVVALLACVTPGLRASRVNPVDVLGR